MDKKYKQLQSFLDNFSTMSSAGISSFETFGGNVVNNMVDNSRLYQRIKVIQDKLNYLNDKLIDANISEIKKRKIKNRIKKIKLRLMSEKKKLIHKL